MPTRQAASLGVTHFLELGQVGARDCKQEGEGGPSYPFLSFVSFLERYLLWENYPTSPASLILCPTVRFQLHPLQTLILTTGSASAAHSHLGLPKLAHLCLCPALIHPLSHPKDHTTQAWYTGHALWCFWNMPGLTSVQHSGDYNSDGLDSYPSSTTGGGLF